MIERLLASGRRRALLAVVAAGVLLVPLALAYGAAVGSSPPGWLVWSTLAILIFGAALVLDAKAGADRTAPPASKDFDRALAAVDGDESRLPPAFAGEPLDTQTPELWPVMRWALVPALVVALAAPGWNEPWAIASLFAITLAMAFLGWLSIGTMIGRITTNDFVLEQAYASRCSVAFFRGQFMLLLAVAGCLLLGLLAVFGVLGPELAVAVAAAWVAIAALLVATLMVAGRPRGLLPAVVRRIGPLSVTAPLPQPLKGAGKSAARSRAAS